MNAVSLSLPECITDGCTAVATRADWCPAHAVACTDCGGFWAACDMRNGLCADCLREVDDDGEPNGCHCGDADCCK